MESKGLAGRSLLSSKGDLSREEIETLLITAEHMRRRVESRTILTCLKGTTVGLAIFENSTRTFGSFKLAAELLGANVTGGIFIEGSGSSEGKGESQRDSLHMIAGRSHLVVVRHALPEFVKEFAPFACGRKPLINAGNGADEHPSQTLLDIFHIARKCGCFRNSSSPDFEALKDVRLALCGDLAHSRTVAGLMAYAEIFGYKVILASPPRLSYNRPIMDPSILCGVTNSLEDALHGANYLYMTRVQKERFTDPAEYEAVKGEFILTREMYERIHPDVTKGPHVMHALPRVDEITENVDLLPNADYFEQADGGVPTRMSLMAHFMGVQNHI